MTNTTEDTIIEELSALHGILQWRDIAKMPQYRGIHFASLSAYARGERPIKNAHHRDILGLTPLIETEACRECGVVHTKRCPLKSGRKPWSSKSIRERPTELLAWQLENRKEF